MVFSGHCKGNSQVILTILIEYEQFKQYDELKLLNPFCCKQNYSWFKV